jgi:hypothetical protein
MKYKENKDRNGFLMGYWDENGKSCLPSEPFEEDGATLKEGNSIEVMPQSEIDANKVIAEQLEADREAKKYQRDRAEQYPPITDYLDGVVKGDQAQIDAYIAACQTVKNKYPKPTGN